MQVSKQNCTLFRELRKKNLIMLKMRTNMMRMTSQLLHKYMVIYNKPLYKQPRTRQPKI